MNQKNAVNPWFVYVVKTNSDTLYCGITTDVARRFKEHSEQGKKCAKYLRGKAPLELVYQTNLPNKSAALQFEYNFKKLSRVRKLAIINEKG